MINPLGLIALLLFIGLFLYANIKEKRSLRANRLEKLIWLSKAKTVFEEKNEKFFGKYISSLRRQNSRPYKPDKHLIRFAMTEESLAGMQVFSWNSAKKEENIILYLHGGAYISPPLSPHFLFANKLSKATNSKIYLPIYKKIPDYDFKLCIDELFELYSKISLRHANISISLAGDSAGASLCLSLLQKIRENGVQKPKCTICLSPWLDLSMENEEIPPLEKIDPSLSCWGLKRLGEIWSFGNTKNPLASPIFGSYEGLSDIHIFVGTREIFLPDCKKFDEILTNQGVPHSLTLAQSMYHVYPLFPIPEARKALKNIARLITG